jgi:hypothetical protein
MFDARVGSCGSFVFVSLPFCVVAAPHKPLSQKDHHTGLKGLLLALRRKLGIYVS